MPLRRPTRATTATTYTHANANAHATRAGMVVPQARSPAASARPPRGAMNATAAVGTRNASRRATPTPAADKERIRKENLAMRQRLLDVKPRALALANAVAPATAPATNANGNITANGNDNGRGRSNGNRATNTPAPRRANVPAAVEAANPTRVGRRRAGPSPVTNNQCANPRNRAAPPNNNARVRTPANENENSTARFTARRATPLRTPGMEHSRPNDTRPQPPARANRTTNGNRNGIRNGPTATTATTNNNNNKSRPAPSRVNVTQARRRTAPSPSPAVVTAATSTPRPSPTYVPRPRRHVTPALRDPKIQQANLELRQRILEAKATAKSRVGCGGSPPTEPRAAQLQTPQPHHAQTALPQTDRMPSDSPRVYDSDAVSNSSEAITASTADLASNSASDLETSSDTMVAHASHTPAESPMDSTVSTSIVNSRVAPLEATITAPVEISSRVDTLAVAPEDADDNGPSLSRAITALSSSAVNGTATASTSATALTLEDILIAEEPFAVGGFGAVFSAEIDSSITSFRSIQGHDEFVNTDPRHPTQMVLKMIHLNRETDVKVEAGRSDNGTKTKTNTRSETNSDNSGLDNPGLAEKTALLAIPPHPGIIKLHAVFEDESAGVLHLLMERGSRGDLQDIRYRLKECIFTEHDARFYAASIAATLQHMHALGFVHRDLKPDNIVIDDHGLPKVIDFGLATRLGPGDRSTDLCGTLVYCAPEILIARAEQVRADDEAAARQNRRHPVGTINVNGSTNIVTESYHYHREGFDRAVDLWAFGVLVYEMLVGVTPFWSCHDDPGMARYFTVNNIMQYGTGGDFSLYFPPEVSKDARELIEKLLSRDPARRLGMNSDAELRNHPWFRGIDWNALFRSQEAPLFDWMREVASQPELELEPDEIFV